MPCRNHPDSISGAVRCGRCAQEYCGDCLVMLGATALCLDCKREHVRDLLSGIEPGALELGSILRRFAALWIDGLITTLATYAVTIPLSLAAGAAGAAAGDNPAGMVAMFVVIAVTYLIMFAIPVTYEGWMLQARGQTVGKILLGLKVVTPDGRDLSRGQAWGRPGLRLVFGSCCLAVDYLPAFFTSDRTCIHDLIATTRVARVRG